jgi:MYXO-CTERM domain-containing protein
MQVAEVRLEGVPKLSTLGLLGLTTVGIAAVRRRRK